MPFKRTFRRKKRVIKRRRYGKRKYRISRPLGRNHVFVRSNVYADYTVSSTVDTFYALEFKLTDVPNYTEFTNLFDEYRIAKVTVMFIPSRIQTNDTATITVPYFLALIDKDDSSAPAAYTDMVQYPGVKIMDCTRKYYVRFVPRFPVTIYNTAVTSAYGSRVGWIDCSNAAVPHYGLKVGFGVSSASSQYTYKVWVKYTIVCRGVR